MKSQRGKTHEVDSFDEIVERLPPSVVALIMQLMSGATPIADLREAKLILADDIKKSFHWFDLPQEKELWEEHTKRGLLFSINEKADVTARIIMEAFNDEGQAVFGIFAKETNHPKIYSAILQMEVELTMIEGVPTMTLVPVSIGATEPVFNLDHPNYNSQESKMMKYLENALHASLFTMPNIAEA